MQQLDFWIRKRASQSPNKVALIQIESGEAWTYEQLLKHAYWWSEQFTKYSLERGERIASLMENSIESFAILFACRLNELIYVPLNTKLTKAELQAIVADCTPTLIVADDVHIERAKGLGGVSSEHAGAGNEAEVLSANAMEVVAESAMDEVLEESVNGLVEICAGSVKNLAKVLAEQGIACTERTIDFADMRMGSEIGEVHMERVAGLAEVCVEREKELSLTAKVKELSEVLVESTRNQAEVCMDLTLGEVRMESASISAERTNDQAKIRVIAAKSEMVEKPTDTSWHDEPNLPWLIIYTGGTTGKPKGVVLSHEAVTTNAINTAISWGLNDADCTLNYMPLFHTGGINALALPMLLVGGTVVIGQKFDPERAIRAIDEYKTTISLFVPTMYQLMTQTAYFEQSTFPTVKVFLSGGAPCPKPIYERFIERGLKFKEGYGLTEAGPNNFVIDASVAMTKKGAVGKSMLFNEVQVMNENGEPCSEGEVGELWLKGSHVFRYYWNNEQETVAMFHNGWLKTGDLAKFDEDGDFYIVGRKKEMIITGGENVYPQEIEQCLILHPAVQEVTVIGVPDEKWGECVVAFIVLKDEDEDAVTDCDALATELKEHCKERLANYKVPKLLKFVKELPKTVVGKIDKKQLQQVALTL